jgi:NAD(P)-dependent dehydrogenase (short-subunit alcohol dehydrogenase family)
MDTSAESRFALVTGSSSGIGRATVEHLVAEGWTVFAASREPATGDRAGAPHGRGELIPIRLDLTDEGQIADAATFVAGRTGGRLHGLVHNAGMAVGGALEHVEPSELRAIFEVNLVGPIALTQALLPQLRRGRGRIVFVGSLGGRVAFPFAGPYHATKFALEGISDSMRLELRPQGVGVAIVEPGAISTPIWRKAGEQVAAQRAGLDREGRELYDERLAAFEERLRSADRHGASPELVAAKIAAALTGSGSRYPVGRGAGTASRLRGLLPSRIFDPIVDRLLG